MTLTKEEKLRKLLEVANEDYVSIDQAKKLFQALIDSVERLKKQISQEADARKNELDNTISSLAAHVLSTTEDELKRKIQDIEADNTEQVREVRENLLKGLETFKQELLSKIPPETDLSDIYTRLEELVIPQADEIEEAVYNNLPKYGDKFRDALELLQGEDRLDKSAIKGLKEEFDTVKKQITSSRGGGARRVFQPYLDDLTASTDGSTKIFYLSREPLSTSTIEVHCTDFPIILRPTTDFTVAGKVVTLTDEVPAPTTGATLLIKYYA